MEIKFITQVFERAKKILIYILKNKINIIHIKYFIKYIHGGILCLIQ